jgi:secreted PhoX family phosphatase
MRATRRRFLVASGLGVAAASAWSVSALVDRASERGAWRPGPFGALRPDPRGVLDLPEGFSYRVVSRSGERMSDGLVVPARPDGMTCFAGPQPGTLVLMRNHENATGMAMFAPNPDGAPIANAFDPAATGGVSRVVLDARTLERVSENVVLAGTSLNCAGGPSPWGWLSCEETVEAGHGYVFACDPDATRAEVPRPIRGYGRFRHEAVAIDPLTHAAYLTEDREDACLYRFVPHDPAAPFEGELLALAIEGRPRMDTGGARPGERLAIRWVPVRDPEPDDDSIRVRAQAEGAAVIRRGEGIAVDPGRAGLSLVLSATVGGREGVGQILRLDVDGDRGELSTVAESRGRSDFDLPDNLTVHAPSGRLFFCEDGIGQNFLRGIDHEGGVFDFARNALSGSELAGVCFSPDGRAMFVNLQLDGLTLAITGPFVA